MKAAHVCPCTLLFLFLACLVAAIPGCEEKAAPSPGTSSTAKPLVGILLYRGNDLYIASVGEAIRKNLAGRADVALFEAKDDQLIQNEQLANLLQRQVAAVAMNQVDIQDASRTVDRLKQAGIPVFFFNREPDLNLLKAYDRARFVGTTPSDAGTLQGKLIASIWKSHPQYDRNGDGICQYLMFQGNADNPEALARTEYSIKVAREQGVAMRQVGQTFICNWDEDLARKSMEYAFARHAEDIEFIVSNNDAMALGAITVLNENGYNLEGKPERFIPVIGVDAIPPAIEAIGKGIMNATVKQDGEAMGKAVAALLLNALAGRDFLDGTPYSWDDSGIAIRIPYAPYEGKQ